MSQPVGLLLTLMCSGDSRFTRQTGAEVRAMMGSDDLLSATRRSLLKAGVAMGATVLLPPVGARAQTSIVRPDIHSSAGKRMLALYEQAVRKMQDPAINISPQPKSWTFQSYIHGVLADPFHPVE